MAGWYENHPDGTTPIQRIMQSDLKNTRPYTPAVLPPDDALELTRLQERFLGQYPEHERRDLRDALNLGYRAGFYHRSRRDTPWPPETVTLHDFLGRAVQVPVRSS